MEKQHYKNLRYSEKIRESECFIEADGLQKKIRKFNASKTPNSIDAEVKMREIECFWKEGWQYNHTHHIYLEPKVTRPRFFMPSSVPSLPQLEHYYNLLQRYLTRLKIDNEDETNFKIEQCHGKCYEEKKEGQSEVEMQLEGVIDFEEDIDERGIAAMTFDHLARVIGEICDQMIANFANSLQFCRNDMMEEPLQEEQIEHLKHISSACSSLRNHTQSQTRSSIQSFMRLAMEVLGESKEEKQFSGVLGTQPAMGELTQVLHPLCWGLYATFAKELLTKEARKKRGKRYADQQGEPLQLSGTFLKEKLSTLQLLKIQDDYRLEEARHSRVLFLNLDGYESEFNLQFMRNFTENLMYVSFPKFNSSTQDQHYNNRFHKKIMYNFTRSELDVLGLNSDEDHQDISLTLQREDLIANPEKYHETIDQLYHTPSNAPQDINKRVFVFPIGLQLQSEHESTAEQRNIKGYESQLLRFIMRDHIFSAIKAFKPHSVLISYTAQLQLENEHFLEMMQEIVKICHKVTFFPNFTPALASPEQLPSTMRSVGRGIISREDECDLWQRVDNFYQQEEYNPWEVQLMDKLSIFLKVSAGFYNLVRPYEEVDLFAKYKQSRVFSYIIHLYTALKNEYEHCKRRVESATLQAARAALETTLREHSKDIDRCVPSYYKRIFGFISELLSGNVEDNQYSLMLQEVRDEYAATFEEDEPYLQRWRDLQRVEELRLASAKYHEISQIEIRQKASREEYLQLKDEKMNHLDSLYRISYYYKEDSNQVVKLYKEVALHWKQNQLAPNSHFYILLTNLFTPGEQEVQHYIAKPKLNSRKTQRCQIIPLTFHDQHGVILLSPFIRWTHWNYAETTKHLLLYWPSRFDLIAYYLSQLLKRNYEPQLLPRVFAATKSNESLSKSESTFFEVNIGEGVDVAPRWGCSSFNVEDQLYILGGCYSSEKSYLDLQNDVTTLDLTDYSPQDFPRTKLRNLNKELYANEAFWGKLRERKEVNSFVRPRVEMEFFEEEEVQLEEGEVEKGNLVIYMIGGYGEQFKTPYSLFVNYFYRITVQRASRRLLSIRKLWVPEKVVPINVRAMMKNRGVYQKANILQAGREQQSCKEGMTNGRHYFHHRVVYALKKQQLLFKIKNLFAIELFENCKKDFYGIARRLGEVRDTEEPEPVIIRKVEGNRHQVLVEFSDLYYLYSLNLEITGEEVEEVPLMNESIIALGTKQQTIYALITHDKHTHSRCILACGDANLSQQSKKKADKEKHYALVLKEIVSFEENLRLHTLIICNLNEVALLHGIGFEHSRAREYLMKVKQKSQVKREQSNALCVNPLQFSSITTFFNKKNNLISSINFLQYAEENQYFAMSRLTLDINRFADGWKPTAPEINKICFIHNNIVLQKVSFQARMDSFGEINILIYAAKKAFHIKLNDIPSNQQQIHLAELTDKAKIQRLKCMETLAKILKNEELYQDFDYFE